MCGTIPRAWLDGLQQGLVAVSSAHYYRSISVLKLLSGSGMKYILEKRLALRIS